MNLPLNGQSAARNARLAQGAAVVLLAGVGVLGAVGIPGLKSPEKPGDMAVPDMEIKLPHPPGQLAQAVDYGSLSSRLGLLENAPAAAEVAGGESVAGQEVVPPPPPPAPVVKYLGSARVGTVMLGLISDAGKQRFVKSGDKLSDESSVKQVTEGAIVVESHGEEHRIELGERAGSLTTAGVPTGPVVPHATGVVAAPRPVAGRAVPPVANQQPSVSQPGAFLRSGYTKDGVHYFDERGGLVTDPQLIRLRQYREKVANSGQYKSEDDIDAAAKKLFEIEEADRSRSGKEQK